MIKQKPTQLQLYLLHQSDIRKGGGREKDAEISNNRVEKKIYLLIADAHNVVEFKSLLRLKCDNESS